MSPGSEWAVDRLVNALVARRLSVKTLLMVDDAEKPERMSEVERVLSAARPGERVLVKSAVVTTASLSKQPWRSVGVQAVGTVSDLVAEQRE